MFIVILAPAKTLFTKASEIFSPPFLSFSVWLSLDLFLGSNKQFKIIQESIFETKRIIPTERLLKIFIPTTEIINAGLGFIE